MTNFNLFALQHTLLSLGHVVPLNLFVNYEEFMKVLSDYQKHFKAYNPKKKGYNRYGLSITSLDGGFSGVPDIDSLKEYNELHGKNFDEPDFRTKTPFFENCHSLNKAMAPFHDVMGRSHILRLDKGGFFPPHRDLSDTAFRLFISFQDNHNYCFILDGKKQVFEKNQVYFINTYLSHSLFSFVDDSLFAIFNIDWTPLAVQSVFSHLSSS